MTGSLTGRTVLITSGPTRAPIDAVRFICNRSTGRLGSWVGECALARGANVIFIQGPDSARPEPADSDCARRLTVLPIETIDDLGEELQSQLKRGDVDATIHAMAVLDYVPDTQRVEKVSSGMSEWILRLVPTPKIITRIKDLAPGTLLVGFKLESDQAEEQLVESAVKLAHSSRAELVVANDITRITVEMHPALLVDPAGNVLSRPMTKAAIAIEICNWLAGRFSKG